MFGQTIKKEKTGLGKSSIVRWVCPAGPCHLYRVCQCIETRNTTKSKAVSGRRAVKMPEKKRNQLCKAVCDKKGVTSMKLAAKMNMLTGPLSAAAGY